MVYVRDGDLASVGFKGMIKYGHGVTISRESIHQVVRSFCRTATAIFRVTVAFFILVSVGECLEKYDKGGYKHASKYNQNSTCVENGGRWVEFSNYLEERPKHTTSEACKAASTSDIPLIWAIPYRTQNLDAKSLQKRCLVALEKPHCDLASWSRDNHLGNGRDGVPLNYTWVLPYFPSKTDQRCIFRIRFVLFFALRQCWNFPVRGSFVIV